MAWRALGLARLGHALAEADAARRLGQHRQRPCDVSVLLRPSGAHAADRRRYATLLAGTGPAVLHGVRLVGGHGDQAVGSGGGILRGRNPHGREWEQNAQPAFSFSCV